MLEKLIDKCYKEFAGLPIVRSRTKNDAFVVVVFYLLYSRQLNIIIDRRYSKELCKYIVAPPDSGIDIFIEFEHGDEYRYDVIQVRNKPLSSSEIQAACVKMKRTIADYCDDPRKVKSKNLQDVFSRTNFEQAYMDNCTYIVVHSGSENDFPGRAHDENIVTKNHLEVLFENCGLSTVKERVLTTDKFGFHMAYGNADEGKYALTCNLCAYDLAIMNNEFASSETGRNILYYGNFREWLPKKQSKTDGPIRATIDKDSENLWYCNNGLTISAGDVELIKNDSNMPLIRLKNFSVSNGAQTIGTFGRYLKEAASNRDQEMVDKLRNTFVSTRITVISDPALKNRAAIGNNTQNPVTSRDLVANRPEQVKLSNWLGNDDYPRVYVERLRGTLVPAAVQKNFKHRMTTNERLAQYACAAFLLQPYVAKDKRSSLFTVEDTDFVNDTYRSIFAYDNSDISKCGVLFRRSKEEIDEILFVQYLYLQAHKHTKNIYTRMIVSEEEKIKNQPDETRMREELIQSYNSVISVSAVAVYYCIAAYYVFKSRFDPMTLNKRYNYELFYEDLQYSRKIARDFADLFLGLTVKILKRNSAEAGKADNINNWVRSSACQDAFLASLDEELTLNLEYKEKFLKYIEEHKTVTI